VRSTLDSTLPWWIAGPILGLVIVSFLALANKRFGVLGGVTVLPMQGQATHGSTRTCQSPARSQSCSVPVC
jgi:hypothetical protein